MPATNDPNALPEIPYDPGEPVSPLDPVRILERAIARRPNVIRAPNPVRDNMDELLDSIATDPIHYVPSQEEPISDYARALTSRPANPESVYPDPNRIIHARPTSEPVQFQTASFAVDYGATDQQVIAVSNTIEPQKYSPIKLKPVWPIPLYEFDVPLYKHRVHVFPHREEIVQAFEFLKVRAPEFYYVQYYVELLTSKKGEVIFLVGWFDGEADTLCDAITQVARDAMLNAKLEPEGQLYVSLYRRMRNEIERQSDGRIHLRDM